MHLKSIAVNNTVPGYTEMRRRYGFPYRRGIKSLGGYKTVVSHAGLKIAHCFRASDGHILSSYYEYLFDEYLCLNGVQHDIDHKICTDSQCRYDFKIGDVYVEIWGISTCFVDVYNNYLERRRTKEALYAKHGLKLLSIEGKDFKRSSVELQTFFKNILWKFGIKSSDKQKKYPIFNRRKLGYWCVETVIQELQHYIIKYGKFPTFNNLLANKQSDLAGAINNFGGFRKFAALLGFAPQTRAYSEERVINTLEPITEQLGHFPCDRELQKMKKSDLASSIKLHGGYGYFKEKVIGKRDKKPFGYWNKEDNVIAELRALTDKLGRFPVYSELGLVAKGVNKSKKGMEYFKEQVYG